MYVPDKWIMVEIKGTDPHYRIFASWSGGYLGSDEWRLNSGVVEVEDGDTHWLFHGHTGSVYKCSKKMYGVTAYGWGVLNSMIERSDGTMKALSDQNEAMVNFLVYNYTDV